MSDQFPDKRKYELGGKTETLGLDYNVAALTCYIPIPLISLIASIVWLMTEPKANLFVRFHALQALMVNGAGVAALIAVSIVGALGNLPIIGFLFGLISGLAWFAMALLWFVANVVMMLKANQREMYKLPYIGDLAEEYAGK